MVEKIKQALERAYNERYNRPSRSNGGNGIDYHNQPEKFFSGKEILSTDEKALAESFSSEILNNARDCEVDTSALWINRIITFDDNDSNIESYRLLRTQLISNMRSDGLCTLGITSSNSGEGKSLTTANLAIMMARSADIDVVLVDGDITHPSVHKLLSVKSEYGLVDVLKGDIEVDRAIFKSNIPNLWVIPGRYERMSLLDKANSSKIKNLISGLSVPSLRLVIVDLPPVLGKDDTLAIAAHLDGVLLVVEEGATKSDSVLRTVELLKSCNLIGSVLNKYSGYHATYY